MGLLLNELYELSYLISLSLYHLLLQLTQLGHKNKPFYTGRDALKL